MGSSKANAPLPRWYLWWRWLARCAIGSFGAVIIASIFITLLLASSLPAQTDHILTSVAFSPDGKYVLTSSYRGLARLWDSETGTMLRTFGDKADGAAFSPDGKLVLTIAFDNDAPARLWNTSTGAMLATLQGDSYGICSAAFSSDNKYILTINWGRSATLWDATKGTMLRRIGHNSTCAAAFSPDNKSVLISERSARVVLRDVATGRTLNTLVVGSNTRDIIFSSDGKYVLLGDNQATLLNMMTGTPVCRIGDSINQIRHVALSPYGNFALTGGFNGVAQLWDLATCRPLRTIGNPNTAYNVAFSPDGTYALTGSNDGFAEMWDLETGQLHRTFAYRVDVPFALLSFTFFNKAVEYGYWIGVWLTILALMSGIVINAWLYQQYSPKVVGWWRLLRLPFAAAVIAVVLYSLAAILVHLAYSVSGYI